MTSTIGNLTCHQSTTQNNKPSRSNWVTHSSTMSTSTDTVILGDIDSHHHLWYSTLAIDTRRDQIAQEMEPSSFAILNEDKPTRITASIISSPGISLANNTLYIRATWTTMVALDSDHRAILVGLQCEVGNTIATGCTFVNFKKADWNSFKSNTEKAFTAPKPLEDVLDGERHFGCIMVKAAAKNILAGCICKVHPFFPRQAAVLAEERDLLQATNRGNGWNTWRALTGIGCFLAVEHSQGALWTTTGT